MKKIIEALEKFRQEIATLENKRQHGPISRLKTNSSLFLSYIEGLCKKSVWHHLADVVNSNLSLQESKGLTHRHLDNLIQNIIDDFYFSLMGYFMSMSESSSLVEELLGVYSTGIETIITAIKKEEGVLINSHKQDLLAPLYELRAFFCAFDFIAKHNIKNLELINFHNELSFLAYITEEYKNNLNQQAVIDQVNKLINLINKVCEKKLSLFYFYINCAGSLGITLPEIQFLFVNELWQSHEEQLNEDLFQNLNQAFSKFGKYLKTELACTTIRQQEDKEQISSLLKQLSFFEQQLLKILPKYRNTFFNAELNKSVVNDQEVILEQITNLHELIRSFELKNLLKGEFGETEINFYIYFVNVVLAEKISALRKTISVDFEKIKNHPLKKFYQEFFAPDFKEDVGNIDTFIVNKINQVFALTTVDQELANVQANHSVTNCN